MSVVATGIAINSASVFSSALASASCTPLPAKIAGDCAAAAAARRRRCHPALRPGGVAGAAARHLLGRRVEVLRKHIHRYVEQHCARACRLRHVERAWHDVHEKLRIVYSPHALADRAVDVALRRVGVQSDALMRLARVVIRRRVAGDDHHGREVGRGRGDAGERVGQPWRQVDVQDSELVRDAEVGVGRVGGLLLMTERDVFDAELVAGVDQRVVRVPALAEYFAHSLLLEAVSDEHRSGHLLLRQGWWGGWGW